MSLKLGETVGSYQVTGQLGQGGMATVYKAYHASLDRYVALKVLHPAFKEDVTFHARFQREARVLAKLEHAHIVPIYDFAEHEGQPYLVMKYIEGETLKSRLAKGPATLTETRQVVDAVGAALAYAHKQGILHRDIKPSNIIITPDDTYYLSDFGLARIASAGESTLSQDTLLGTPNYISPEQAQGLADLDGRTDIYSLGVVLYEMIVGRVPFSGDTPFAVIHDHIYSPLPPPSVVNPSISEPLEKFLLKALAKDRSDRFADATALVTAFHQIVTDPLPGVTQPATTHAPIPSADPTLVRPHSVSATVKRPPAAVTIKSQKESSPPLVAQTKKTNGLLIGGGLLVVIILGLASLFTVSRLMRNQSRATPSAPPSSVPPGTKLPPTLAVTADPIAQAQATVAADPDNIAAHLQLGDAYRGAGLSEAALSEYTTAAELANYSSDFYQNTLPPHLESDPILELTVLSAGLRYNPSRKLWELAAPLMDEVSRLPAGTPTLEQLARDFPDQAAVQATLVRHYIKFDQLDQAKAILDPLQTRWPDETATHFATGDYLAATGDTAAAIAEYQLIVDTPKVLPFVRRVAEQRIKELKGTPTP